MKAAVYYRYGPADVVTVTEMQQPQPKPHQLLIRVHAACLNSADVRLRRLQVPLGFGLLSRLVFGITAPRRPILGADLAGRVVAIGSQVSHFQPGDKVIALTGITMGAHAEYICLDAKGAIAPMPRGLDFHEAAALVFGGTTALDFLRRGRLSAGETIAINGAGGAVGCAAIQLARHWGAKVTAICSASKRELVRRLGAAEVVDYQQEDFTRGDERYDLIMDTQGNAPWAESRRALAPAGRLLAVCATLPQMLQALVLPLWQRERVIAGPCAERAQDLAELAQLAEAGVLRPVIDRVYPLAQIAEAHRYVEQGHKQGSVVIDMMATSTDRY
ncbi:NAD(P)-dependent alcohol dehydrogenase [Cellvibrio fontiphilus]|uniref:NAD(P)-dependent alcohol dehydrogenase n=1 Tax=Cellvibrio fontiphilus TaxID=1815559 RepID=A0ABV7FET9_9GAMM